ncbi:MAG: 30S ribosomal protein S1, partial [Carnobacterium sp.]
DEIKVKVLEVNPTDQRLSLSIKALEEKPASEKSEKEDVVDYTLPEEDSGFTLGDILGEQLSDMTSEDDE